MKHILTTIILMTSFIISSSGQTKDTVWKSSTISIPVKDLDKASDWYKKLLNIENTIAPVPGLLEFKINETTWIQLFVSEKIVPAENTMRFEVSNIEAEHKRLKSFISEIMKVEYIEGVVAYFDFEDLDGNRLSFYQIP